MEELSESYIITRQTYKFWKIASLLYEYLDNGLK